MRRLERLQRECSWYFVVWTSDLRRLARYTSVRLALVERSRFHLWATALVLSAVLAGTSRAAVYRVAPSGNDAAKGTAEVPWKTLDKALASVKPGDIVELETGTYTFAPPKTALADKMVTIRPTAKAAGKVVLQGRFTDYEGQSSFLRFEGLDIQSCVRFHKVKWTQFVRCRFSGKSHWGVAFLDAEHIGLYGCTVATDTASQVMMGGGRHFEYRYNEIPRGASDVFQGHADDLLIEGNWVHDVKPGPGAHADGIQLGNCRGITVRGNVFDCPNMQTFFFAWTAKESTYDDILIENNVCTTAQVHPLTLRPSTDAVVRNNLFVPGPGTDYNSGSIHTAGAKGKVTFQNNIICLLGMKVRPQDTASNNVYIKCSKDMAGPGMLGKQVPIEELFVDRVTRDYRPTEGSPMTSAAAAGSWPARDILGRERPKEKACIGPIERLASDDKPLMDLWQAHFTRMQKEVVPPNPPSRGDGRAEKSESPTEQPADVERIAPSAQAPASADKAVSPLSFSELMATVSEAPAGVIDLGGNAYVWDYVGPHNNYIPKEWAGKTIKNAILIGFRDASAITDEGGGIVSFKYDTSRNFMPQIWDPFAPDYSPYLAQFPPQPNHVRSSYGSTQNWWPLTSAKPPRGKVIPDGTKLAGFLIADDQLKHDVKAALDMAAKTKDAAGREAVMLTSCLMCQVNPNQVHQTAIASYSETAGSGNDIEIRFAKAYHNNAYLSRFCLYGQKEWLTRAGTFTPDSSGTIYYRPLGTKPSQLFCSQDGNGISGQLFRTKNTACTFEDVTFIGDPGSGHGCMFTSSGGFTETMTFKNCVFRLGGTAVSLYCPLVISGCSFLNQINYAAGISKFGEKNLIENSRFEGMEQHSALAMTNSKSQQSLPRAEVRGCYFDLSVSNHGQAISAYAGSFHNWYIHHNIFVNANRTLSYQGLPENGETDLGTYNGLRIENNLFYLDKDASMIASGQLGIAANGRRDESRLTNVPPVHYRNNTFLAEPKYLARKPGEARRLSLDVHHDSYDIMTGNVFYALGDVRNGKLESGSNLVMSFRELQPRYSREDLWKPRGATTYAEIYHLLYGHGAAGIKQGVSPKYDGIGIRWSSYPKLSELSSLPVKWAETHEELPLPEFRTAAAKPGSNERPASERIAMSATYVADNMDTEKSRIPRTWQDTGEGTGAIYPGALDLGRNLRQGGGPGTPPNFNGWTVGVTKAWWEIAGGDVTAREFAHKWRWTFQWEANGKTVIRKKTEGASAGVGQTGSSKAPALVFYNGFSDGNDKAWPTSNGTTVMITATEVKADYFGYE